jgi:predicted N-acetyltransferase YhbS
LTDDPKYIVKPLGDEDRAAFQCGDPELDSYFHERASRDIREKLSAVFVLITEGEPDVILGYYTLSAQQVDAVELPEALRKRTGRYKRLGVTLLGRLAVAKGYQGKQLGALLLVDALRRSLEGTKSVMSFAVVVDAKNNQVVNFYKKFGFVLLSGNRLMLPMKTIEKNFQSLPTKP